MLQGEEGAAGGVEEEAAVMKAKELPTHLEDDGAVDVGDGVVAVGEADRLLSHGEAHRVRCSRLRGTCRRTVSDNVGVGVGVVGGGGTVVQWWSFKVSSD